MKWAFLCLLLLTSFTCLSQEWSSKVVEVIEGDVYEVQRPSGKTITVRLYGVYCPEPEQPYGSQAIDQVTDKILNKNVKILGIGKDPQGFISAEVHLKNLFINKYLVRQGLAWVSPNHCKQADCDRWKAIQEQQREAETGLWAQDQPTPPWKYR